MHFPAHEVGGQPELWDIRGYGLSRLWVMRGPTVCPLFRVYSFILQCGPLNDLSFILVYNLQFLALPHHLNHYLFLVPVSNLALPHSGILHVSSWWLEYGELYNIQPILAKNLQNHNYHLFSPSVHLHYPPHL